MPILIMGIVAVIALIVIFGLCIGASLEEPKPEEPKVEEYRGKKVA